MEQSDTSVPEEKTKRSTPWGVIIGLILILAIVVGGAYYSFTKRYHPASASPSMQGQ